MKAREQRWPSSWAFEIRTREARFLARVTNVSVSGLRFEGQVVARPGQTVKFKVLGQVVTGRITRISLVDGAVVFTKKIDAVQLSIMRQCRAYSDV